jgi:hypothetical protein
MFDLEPPDRKAKTETFFWRVKTRGDILYVSDVVLDEIAHAPRAFTIFLDQGHGAKPAACASRIARDVSTSGRLRYFAGSSVQLSR